MTQKSPDHCTILLLNPSLVVLSVRPGTGELDLPVGAVWASPAHPEDFVAEEPFVLIHIARSMGLDLSVKYPADVYAAVSGHWRIDPGACKLGFLVLARNVDRVLGAYRVESWAESEESEGRWGFVGHPAEISVQLRYVGKRVPDRYRTSRNPIQFGDRE